VLVAALALRHSSPGSRFYYVNAKNAFGGYTGEKPFAFEYQCPVNKECKMIDYAIPDSQHEGELKWQNNVY
jgi:hypothetical protein